MAMSSLSRLLRALSCFALGCGSTAGAGTGAGDNPDGPQPPSDIVFSVDAASSFTISRFIYGGNFLESESTWGGATTPTEMTVSRMGGNRLSAYNWETNYSNAGNDYEFHNDAFLSESSRPGEAVRTRASAAFAKGQAFMATIPMLPYVAADQCGCNVGMTEAGRTARLAAHFKVSRAFKGSPLTATPNTGDSTVAQDEFVQWFESTFPGRSTHPTAPVFFSLDNEVDLWSSTHQEIYPNLNDNKSTPHLQTYRSLIDTSIVYARAVKSVLPNALVFGPAVATYAGIAVLGRYPTPDPEYGTQNFVDIYLDRMKAAEATNGRRLLDVLDVHHYPAIGTRGGEITNDFAPQDSATIWARVNAPRTLWDPTFDEKTWVSGVTNGPVRLLPRLQAQIAQHYPGTRLAITEYYFGRGGDISGGIAQADALGVFGREGVFAATLWPQAGTYAQPYAGDGTKAYAYAFAAFRMFRNYDGSGGRFGDSGLKASTNNVAASSVYASRDSSGNIVLIAINKTNAVLPARLAITGATGLRTAHVYTLTAASAKSVRQPDLDLSASPSALSYSMPAMSVSTIVLIK
jgi:Glycoside hydrolase family 44